jgi:hypothetical protein
MPRSKFLLAAALVGIALLFATSTAAASTITVMITDGGVTQTVTPNPSSTTGVYTFTATTANYSLLVGTVVTTNDNLADPTMATLSVSLNGMEKVTASSGLHLLTVKVTDSNFAAAAGRQYDASSGGLATASGQTSLTHSSNFDSGALTLMEGPVSGTGAVFLPAATGQFTSTGTSMTITDTTTITTNKTGETFFSTTTSNANIVIPEPLSIAMALSGVGIVGVGTWVRRRKVKV